MDLGAFLAAGAHPVFLFDDPAKSEPWGHVLSRPGRPVSWLAREAASPDSPVTIAIDLPGYGLLPDGSLRPDEALSAPLVLSGVVRSCRVLARNGPFVLRFGSLVRLLA
ncbi:MAG: hypothetical protein LBU12_03770 [Deltaproteobacteria bacterium]|jgi:hypothetical protein|nr:hypothetical protein [Deltaproteobacteria bacterium]